MGNYAPRDLMNAVRRIKAAQKHYEAQVMKCSEAELRMVLGPHAPHLLEGALQMRREALERTYNRG